MRTTLFTVFFVFEALSRQKHPLKGSFKDLESDQGPGRDVKQQPNKNNVSDPACSFTARHF